MIVRLSKSRNAVLFMSGDGKVFITSVKYLRRLIDGQLNGDLLFCKQLGDVCVGTAVS